MIQFPKDLYFEVVDSKNVFELEAVQSEAIHEFDAVNTIQVVEGVPTYDGEYEVTPLAKSEVVLDTKDKLMEDNVTVKKITKFETTNPGGGYTLYIAEME